MSVVLVGSVFFVGCASAASRRCVIDIGCLDFFIIPSAPHPINRSGLAVYQIHIADFLRQIQEVSTSLILAVILPAGSSPEAPGKLKTLLTSAKSKEATSNEVASFDLATPPSGRQGGRVLGGSGRGCRVPWQVLPLGSRVILMRLRVTKVKVQLNTVSRWPLMG